MPQKVLFLAGVNPRDWSFWETIEQNLCKSGFQLIFSKKNYADILDPYAHWKISNNISNFVTFENQRWPLLLIGGSTSEEGIAQKEEVIFQEILFKEEIVVQQSEVLEFVMESFQGRLEVAGRMELQGKILNWFCGNEKQELP